jgi:hypothetical protein
MLDLIINSDNLYHCGSTTDNKELIATDADNDVYGHLPHGTNKYGDTYYEVSMSDIKAGLKAAVLGTFLTTSDDPDDELMRADIAVYRLFADLDEEENLLDDDDIDVLWQIICFNEIIYG